MNGRTIGQINEALRNSFAAIKQDMLDIRSSINVQAHDLREMKGAFDTLKGESVTSDKLNLVKIRIGELNESLKRIWGIEEQLKALEDKLVSKAFVNQQTDGLSIKINDLRGKLESFAKSYVSELQAKKLVEDINKELNSLRTGVDEVKSIKDTISQRTLEKIAFKMNGRLEDLNSRFNVLSSEVKSSIEDLRNQNKNVVSEKQVSDLIHDINNEFDRVKEVLHNNSTAIEQLRESVMNSERSVKSSFKRELEHTNSRLALLQGEMSSKAAVYSAPVRPEKKSKGKKEIASVPPVEIKGASVRKPLRKTRFFANLLIAAAFVSFILSIISFIVDNPSMSDSFGVVALVTFIIGLLLRFIIFMRKRSYDHD